MTSRTDTRSSTDPHDLPLGHLTSCQICGSTHLELVLDLGHMPPCDSLLTPAALDHAETSYPLRMVRCRACGLAQIDHVVAPEILFHPEYPYISGITPSLAANLRGTARSVVERFKLQPGALAMDIGSNDGTLLQGFVELGIDVLGVEATNVAQLARKNGIDTIQSFFDEDVAARIAADRGQASAITATNMFAHVQRLGSMLRGVSSLLVDGGVFVSESHYLLDLLDTLQYDSIYHEHLKFYSMKPLIQLLGAYGFTVADVERIPNYGGSIRVYAVKGDSPVAPAVGELIAEEERAGVYSGEAFRTFTSRVQKSKRELRSMLVGLAAEGRPAPAIGSPGRAATLLNYCGIDPDLMPYIAEQSTSLKLGLCMPQNHIPVVDESRLFEESPDYAVMLSWHYADAIVAKLRERGLRSKIIVPLPEPYVLEP